LVLAFTFGEAKVEYPEIKMNKMKAYVGQFVVANACFCEDAAKPTEQQRTKSRPLMVIAAMLAPDGEYVYLCAKVSTQTHTVIGDIEVFISEEHAKLVGMVKEGVCRFNRTALVAVRESQIRHFLGSYKKLPAHVQHALRNASKSANCPI
jgi:hypothetical protein